MKQQTLSLKKEVISQTPTSIKVIGILGLLYGIFYAGIFVLIALWGLYLSFEYPPGLEDEGTLAYVGLGYLLLFGVLVCISSLALLRRKNWGRVMLLIILPLNYAIRLIELIRTYLSSNVQVGSGGFVSSGIDMLIGILTYVALVYFLIFSKSARETFSKK